MALCRELSNLRPIAREDADVDSVEEVVGAAEVVGEAEEEGAEEVELAERV
jgi:peroxiredoxin family protein